MKKLLLVVLLSWLAAAGCSLLAEPAPEPPPDLLIEDLDWQEAAPPRPIGPADEWVA